MIDRMADWAYDYEGLVFVVVMLLLVVFILGIGLGATIMECNRIEQISDRRTEWYFIGGCYVEVNDELIPLDAWYEVSNSR